MDAHSFRFDEQPAALDDGLRRALASLEEHKDHIEALARDERVLWWSGFIAACFGAAGASVGPLSLEKLSETLGRMTVTVAAARLH